MKKNVHYLLSVAVLMLLSVRANAAVIYRSILVTSDSFSPYQLDVNNDGTKDYKFTTVYMSGAGYADYITGLNGNLIETETGVEAKRLVLGDAVGNNQWNDTAYTARNNESSGTFGSIDGQGYAGLKFTVGGNTYYGWVRIYLAFGQCQIVSCAYQNTPNTNITVTPPTGIEDVKQTGAFKIYCANNFLNITSEQSEKPEQVNIYDVNGKLMSQINQPASDRFDVSAFAAGIYFAEVKVKDVMQRVRWVKM